MKNNLNSNTTVYDKVFYIDFPDPGSPCCSNYMCSIYTPSDVYFVFSLVFRPDYYRPKFYQNLDPDNFSEFVL